MKAYVVTDEMMKNIILYMVDLDRAIDDNTLSKEDRKRNLYRWQGARRVLRRMGIMHEELFALEDKYSGAVTMPE